MEPELKELMAAVEACANGGLDDHFVCEGKPWQCPVVEREAAAFAVRIIEQIQQRASSMASFDGNAALGASEIGAFADRWRKVLEAK